MFTKLVYISPRRRLLGMPFDDARGGLRGGGAVVFAARYQQQCEHLFFGRITYSQAFDRRFSADRKLGVAITIVLGFELPAQPDQGAAVAHALDPGGQLIISRVFGLRSGDSVSILVMCLKQQS